MKKIKWDHHPLNRMLAAIMAALILVTVVPTDSKMYAATYNGSTYYMGSMEVNDIIMSGTTLIGYTRGGGQYDFARIFINNTEYKLFEGGSGWSGYTIPGNYMVVQKLVNPTASGDGSYGRGSSDGRYYWCYLYLSTYYTANFYSNGNGTVSTSGGNYAGGSGKSCTATPNTGYHFTGWTGTTSNSSGTISISGRSGTWYANFAANSYTVNYYGNGTTNGVSAYSSSHTYNSARNLTANKYERTGYTFLGWSASSSASTASYTNGQPVNNLTSSNGGNVNLYAVWIKNQSTIQIDLNGGRWTETAGTEFSENTSFTKEYESTADIPNPVKTGSTFAGWTLTNAVDGKAELGLGKYKYTFGSETETVVLTAIWRDSTAVEMIDNSRFAVNAQQLQNLFDSSNLVTEPDRGITSEEISRGSVNIKVAVDDITAGDSDSAEEQTAIDAIESAVGKLSPKFFDISVIKTVIPEGSSAAEEPVKLSELPEGSPVKVVIDVTGTELEGKKSFYVFRYHNGNVQQLSYRNTGGEFYTVNGNIITVYTRKFSTYAIAAGEVSLEGADITAYQNNGPAVDVQGKVSDAYNVPVYKLDVTWGAMIFEYGAAETQWDAETHSYVTAGAGAKDIGWIERGFEDGNNQIIVFNHSNSDVLLSFAVTKTGTGLDTVNMSVCQENTSESAEAADITLAKVPQEEAEAPSVQAWLRIDGRPADISDYKKETYTKAGVITVTVQSADGTLTPKN